MALVLEAIGRHHLCFETILREVLRVEGDYEICVAGFSAEAKRIVLGIGRKFARWPQLDLFGSLADQVDECFR